MVKDQSGHGKLDLSAMLWMSGIAATPLPNWRVRGSIYLWESRTAFDDEFNQPNCLTEGDLPKYWLSSMHILVGQEYQHQKMKLENGLIIALGSKWRWTRITLFTIYLPLRQSTTRCKSHDLCGPAKQTLFLDWQGSSCWRHRRMLLFCSSTRWTRMGVDKWHSRQLYPTRTIPSVSRSSPCRSSGFRSQFWQKRYDNIQSF